jgi:hypothetical protein
VQRTVQNFDGTYNTLHKTRNTKHGEFVGKGIEHKQLSVFSLHHNMDEVVLANKAAPTGKQK